MNKTIGILAYYWPPAGGSGVQRWLRFANHLGDLGWDVHVFTFKNPKYPIREKSSLEIINPKIKVNKIKGFEFPKFMTSPSENILFNNYYSDYSSTQSYMYDQVARKFIYTLRELFLFPDARRFLINPSYKFLKNYFRKHNLNHLITTGPPHSMHLAGMKLKKDSGIKWIADFRDPWSNFFQNKLLNELDLTIKKHEKAEADVLKNCDGVFTTSESLKSKFSIKNKNSYYVPSGFEKEIESTDHNKF